MTGEFVDPETQKHGLACVTNVLSAYEQGYSKACEPKYTALYTSDSEATKSRPNETSNFEMSFVALDANQKLLEDYDEYQTFQLLQYYAEIGSSVATTTYAELRVGIIRHYKSQAIEDFFQEYKKSNIHEANEAAVVNQDIQDELVDVYFKVEQASREAISNVRNSYSAVDAKVEAYNTTSNARNLVLDVEIGDTLVIYKSTLHSVVDSTATVERVVVEIFDSTTDSLKRTFTLLRAECISQNFKYEKSLFEPSLRTDFSLVYSEVKEILALADRSDELREISLLFHQYLTEQNSQRKIRLAISGNDNASALSELVTNKSIENLDKILSEIDIFVHKFEGEYFFDELRLAVANAIDKVPKYIEDCDMLESMGLDPRDATADELTELEKFFRYNI